MSRLVIFFVFVDGSFYFDYVRVLCDDLAFSRFGLLKWDFVGIVGEKLYYRVVFFGYINLVGWRFCLFGKVEEIKVLGRVEFSFVFI